MHPRKKVLIGMLFGFFIMLVVLMIPMLRGGGSISDPDDVKIMLQDRVDESSLLSGTVIYVELVGPSRCTVHQVGSACIQNVEAVLGVGSFGSELITAECHESLYFQNYCIITSRQR